MQPCLVPISDFSWITFKPDDKTLVVSSSNLDNVGYYAIVLVQSFVNFTDIYPYTKFNIDIREFPIISIIKKPPYFQPALTN